MVKRRQINVTLPQSQSGLVSMGNMRLQPNYSLNSIQPSPTNPRRRDLERCGINLAAVKKVMRKDGESLGAFQERVEKWIDEAKGFSEEAKNAWHSLLSLALSISQDGLNQPVTVRLVERTDQVATLVSGERRFLASWLANMGSVHAIVRVQDDTEASAHALVENTQRSDLSLPATIEALIAMQADREEPFTVSEIMRLSSKSRGSAFCIHKAVNLPLDHPVHSSLNEGVITKPFHIKQALDELDAEKATENGTPQGASFPGAEIGGSGLSPNEESDRQPQPDDTTPTPAKRKPSNSNASQVGAAHASNEEWEQIKNWLAKACLDAHEISGATYQGLSDDLDKVRTPDMLLEFVKKAAAASGEA